MTGAGGGPVAGPVGIIAGGQEVPLEVAEALKEAGRDYCLFGLVGEADSRIEDHPHQWLKWGEIGTLFKQIEQKGIKDLLFIGSINARPDFRSIRLDFGAVRALPEILKIMASGGDEGVLGGVAQFVEKRGFNLLSARDVAPSLVIGSDLSVGRGLAAKHQADIDHAAKAAMMIGALDAGQGVVVAAGRVLAMEGPEGTDQMLSRVARIGSERRARWQFGKQGLLLKRARPGQDLRFDMPAIGPRTIENVKKAGLAGIICAEGEVLCARRAETMKLAGEAGLFLEARSFKDIGAE